MMLNRKMILTVALCLAPAASGAVALAQSSGAPSPPGAGRAAETAAPKRPLDVPFVPTRQEVVDQMLKMADVDKNDHVIDLGSGDGRIVISAAKLGARGVGVDINPVRIGESRENARAAGVQERVRFIEGDLFAADLTGATAVTLYLLPDVNLKLRPKLLRELRPGTPVVSHDFDMGEWQPDRTVQMGTATVYQWIVPAQVAGTWTSRIGEGAQARDLGLNLNQEFQVVGGSARMKDGKRLPLSDVTLRGDALSFTVAGAPEGSLVFRGKANGDKIEGTVAPAAKPDQTQPWTAQKAGTSTARR